MNSNNRAIETCPTDKPLGRRVCFIAPKAYPLFNPDVKEIFGGAEVDLYFIATELAKDKNFAVSLITADYGQQKIETIEGIRIIKSLNFKGNCLTGAIKVWWGLRQADAEMYMIKTISPGMFLVAFFCWIKRKTFLFRTSNTNSCDGTYLRQHPVFGALYKWAVRSAHQVFVQNKTDRENLQRTTKVTSVAIPNAHRLVSAKLRAVAGLVELAEGQRDTILWVGRSAEIKRPMLFIDLAEKTPDENFTMICQRATGDKKYNKLIARAKQVKNLQFIEQVDFDKVSSYFQRAKVFLNTSDAEGFPNTFIQACEFGTPILSLNVNPDGFLDEYKCGICCNGNIQRLADSLRFMLAEDKYIEMGEKGRKYVEQNHDIEKTVEQYKKTFRQQIRPKTEDPSLESDSMERFAFGKNWRSFSERLQPEDYLKAKESLEKLIPNLKGKTFLDVGSGSGMFSIAASALGAKKVLGFDVDPEAVSTSKTLIEKISQWDPAVKKGAIDFQVESIMNKSINIEPYDIVYSWGVLHHTGDMYTAFDAIKNLVTEKGTLVLAIYNKHFTSPVWKMIKYTYIKSPKFIKTIMVFIILVIKFFTALIILRQNPLQRRRGMRYYTDIVDWVGGYPYQYASVSEVTDFFEARGFKLTKLIKTKGFTGCNEFVFEKVA